MQPRSRLLLDSEDGTAILEMALTLTALFTLLYCFFEMCLALYSYNLISECAREGTRYAMVRGASCPNSTNPTCEVTATEVNNYVYGLGYPNVGGGTMTVSTTYPNGNEAVGSIVKVKVTYVLNISMPLVPSSAITMSSASQQYIVQ